MSPSAEILLVDSDQTTRRTLGEKLEREGYRICEAGSVQVARQLLLQRPPGLLLIGWTLPRRSGLALTETVRREGVSTRLPIIMLAPSADEDGIVEALETGADDCLSRPFSDQELLARIRAIMRRQCAPVSDTLQIAELSLDRATHSLIIGGRPVVLAPTEFNILAHLMAQPERVHGRGELLQRRWSAGRTGPRAVDVHVQRIRRALEPYGCDRYIQTVRGYGYRFSTRVD